MIAVKYALYPCLVERQQEVKTTMNNKIKTMAGLALLTALIAVLQFVGGMIPPVGGFSISLVLIPSSSAQPFTARRQAHSWAVYLAQS